MRYAGLNQPSPRHIVDQRARFFRPNIYIICALIGDFQSINATNETQSCSTDLTECYRSWRYCLMRVLPNGLSTRSLMPNTRSTIYVSGASQVSTRYVPWDLDVLDRSDRGSIDRHKYSDSGEEEMVEVMDIPLVLEM